ncbi:MAG: efflux RND transporter periplasmic adaptor subunit [Rhodospirillaceae bacterium]
MTDPDPVLSPEPSPSATASAPRSWKRRVLFLIPILLGVGVLMLAVQSKAPPVQAEAQERITPVRVITLDPIDVVPRARGYGAVKPGRVWDAVAEVAGRVTWVHPELKNGSILPKDTALVRIEDIDYQLSLRQAEAELKELEIREANTKATLEIEQRTLALLEADLERQQALRQRGASAQTTVDSAERAVLASRKTAQDLQNTLALLPSERAVVEARRDQAQLDLERVEIRAPFTLRIGAVEVEQAQYAATGQVLFSADSIDVAEIEAQIPLDRLMPLIAHSAISPVSADDFAAGGNGSGSSVMERLREAINITPVVRLTQGDVQIEWQAKLSRTAQQVDPETRTMGIVVQVEDPYRQALPGQRPPLTRNMFLEVVLYGAPRADSLVVPRSALRDGALLLVDGDNRLQRQPVEIAFHQQDYTVLSGGITPGSQVILSDLLPAVEGMLLDPRPDPAAQTALQALSEGAAAP